MSDWKYEVVVHEDGDTEIRRTTKVDPWVTHVVLPDLESLRAELRDYGHPDDCVEDAIEEMLSLEDTNEWVMI